RNVEERVAELPIQIRVVERLALARREAVRLAELVIHQPAVGVIHAGAPGAEAPVPLDDECVVTGPAEVRAMRQDVAELRERAQQLSARDRGGAAEVAERRVAEERVRHEL